MQEVITYSNVLLTVLTGIYVYLTYKISKTNSDLLKEQTRPFVVVKFPLEDNALDIVIENIGLRPAYNVSIKILNLEELKSVIHPHKLNAGDFNKQSDLFQHTFLPPNQIIRDFINFSELILKKENLELPFLKLEISYLDTYKKKYKEEYTISLQSYLYKSKIKQFTDTYFIEEISKQLKEINKTLKAKK